MNDLIILLLSIITLVLLHWPEKTENKNQQISSTK